MAIKLKNILLAHCCLYSCTCFRRLSFWRKVHLVLSLDNLLIMCIVYLFHKIKITYTIYIYIKMNYTSKRNKALCQLCKIISK